ncbi:MAG: GAF domain-containing protein [Anaerolineales bacterium]|nr:GAF domain-containing protein [Anaerolineales bacterium]
MDNRPVIPLEISPDLADTLTQTNQTITDIVDDDVAIVTWLVEPDGSLAVCAQANAGDKVGEALHLLANTDDFAMTCFTTAALQERDDLSAAQDFVAKAYARTRDWRSGRAYPLQTKEARYGALAVYSIGRQGLTRRAQRQIEAMINLIPSALESHYQTYILVRLNQLSQTLTTLTPDSANSYRDLLQTVVNYALGVLRADTVSLYEYDQGEKSFLLPAIHAGKHFHLATAPEIRKSDSMYSLIEFGEPRYVKFAHSSFLAEEREVEYENYPKERYVIREQIESTAILPLQVEQQKTGLLFISYRTPQAFSAQQRGVIEAFAAQVATVVLNARLYRNITEQAKQLDKIREITGVIHEELDIQVTLDEAVKQLAQLFNVPQSALVLFNEDNETSRLAAEYISPDCQECISAKELATVIPLKGNQSIEWMKHEKRPLRVTDAQNDPILAPVHKVMRDRHTVSIMIVPLISRTGDVFGTIGLDVVGEKREFTEEEANLAQLVANQIAIAYENAALYEKREDLARQLERKVDNLNALNDIGQKLSSLVEATEEDIIDSIRDQANEVAPGQNIYIALYNHKTDEISFPLYQEEKAGEVTRKDIPSRGLNREKLGKTEEIMLTGESLLHKTRHESIDWYSKPNHQEFVGDMPASWLGVPMVVAGKVMGVIAVYHMEQEYYYDESDLDIFTTLASQAAIALQNARLYRRAADAIHNLQEIGQHLTTQVNISKEKVQEILHDAAHQITQADGVYIAWYNGPTKEITGQLCQSGEHHKSLTSRTLDENNQDRTEWVILNRHPLLHRTKQEVEDWYNEAPNRCDFNKEAIGSTFVVPIIIENQAVGALGIFDTKREYIFDELHVEILETIASQVAIALNNATLYDRIAANLSVTTLGTAMAALQHRISNTLNIIPPSIKRLRSRVDLQDNTIRETLEIIDRNVEYVNDMVIRVQELLQNVNKQPIDINALLADIIGKVQDSQPETIRTSIEVIPKFDEAIPYIEISVSQIAEVIRNLVENAYKVMPSGGQLTVSSRYISQQVHIWVQDTGSGIPPNIKEKLFRKPVPSKEPGGGSGLGLWLSHLILQTIGGSIKMERTGETGTIFLVTIPGPQSGGET